MKIYSSLYRIHLILTLATLGFAGQSMAQQLPTLNTYIYFPENYNPAAFGNGEVGVFYKRQWTDIDSKIAPRTFALYGDFSSLIPFDDRVGVKFNLLADQAHVFKRTNFDFSFGYSLFKNNQQNLSLGIIAGMLNQRLDFSVLDPNSITDIAIYNGNEQVTTFNGGPGLYYHFTNDKDVFSFHATIPQLFTSDLQYEEEINQTYTIKPHTLIGAQYLKKFEVVSLESNLLFRGSGGEEAVFNKNTFDVNVRLFFLEDRFWFGTGYRVNGDTFLGSLGTSALENKLEIFGFYEIHSEFGGSFEFGVIYRFDEQEHNRRQANEQQLEDILNDLKRQNTKLEGVRPGLLAANFSQANISLRSVENSISQFDYTGLTSEEKKNKINDANYYLNRAKNELNKYYQNVQIVTNTTWTTKRIMEKVASKEIKNKQLDKQAEMIENEGKNILDPYLNAREKYLELVGQVKGLRQQLNVDRPIHALYREKKYNELEIKFQRALEQALGVHPKAKVKVKPSDSQAQKIVYSFPYIGDCYTLNGEINPQKLVLDHIIKQIQELKKNGVQIRNVKLKLLLQGEVNSMQGINTMYPYLGEFNTPIKVGARLIDTENEDNQMVPLSEIIDLGDGTNRLELAGLKIYGISAYLKANGVTGLSDWDQEITGPNYEEESPQTMVIEITTKM